MARVCTSSSQYPAYHDIRSLGQTTQQVGEDDARLQSHHIVIWPGKDEHTKHETSGDDCATSLSTLAREMGTTTPGTNKNGTSSRTKPLDQAASAYHHNTASNLFVLITSLPYDQHAGLLPRLQTVPTEAQHISVRPMIPKPPWLVH